MRRTRLIVAKTLEFEGNTCAYTTNGPEALDRVGRFKPTAGSKGDACVALAAQVPRNPDPRGVDNLARVRASRCQHSVNTCSRGLHDLVLCRLFRLHQVQSGFGHLA